MSINIYTAVRLCMFPPELMLNSEIYVDEEYCTQFDRRSLKFQRARQQVNVHQPTRQPDWFLIEAGQGAFTAIFQ